MKFLHPSLAITQRHRIKTEFPTIGVCVCGGGGGGVGGEGDEAREGEMGGKGSL